MKAKNSMTLTRPEHMVLPFFHGALMFERFTCYILVTKFGMFMDHSIGQQKWICLY